MIFRHFDCPDMIPLETAEEFDGGLRKSPHCTTVVGHSRRYLLIQYDPGEARTHDLKIMDQYVTNTQALSDHSYYFYMKTNNILEKFCI